MDKFKFKIPKSVLVLLALSFILNIFRIILFGKFSLIYILWNLFLALIPFAISSLLLKYLNKNKLNKTLLLIGGIFWLFFIPNSPYIVTDLIHIGEIHLVPVLYDSVLIFSSALAGLILGMHSIYHMEHILAEKYSQKISSFIIIITIAFISFGVYLGRFLRFNSWDIFASPLSFINGVSEIFTNRNILVESVFYTILFFLFIFMSYFHSQII